jgi:predicted DNA-binding transcriptional regulator YafY
VEIVSWVLGFGKTAQVVEPAALREAVLRDLPLHPAAGDLE